MVDLHTCLEPSQIQLILTGVQQTDTHPRIDEARVTMADKPQTTMIAQNKARTVSKVLQETMKMENMNYYYLSV